MRKALSILGLGFLLLAFSSYGGAVRAQMGHGMMGPGYGMGPGMMGGGGYGGWHCPYCGQHMGPGGGYGMGPGMMAPGYGMGPGMMGHGMCPGMTHPGYPGYGPQYQQPPKPMGEKDAKAILENYLKSTRNPNLKLGKIKEQDYYFEAEILTKDNSLVDRILLDRFTGWMRSVY